MSGQENKTLELIHLKIAKAGRYSCFVRWMRQALPVAAAVLAVLLLTWPSVHTSEVKTLPPTTMGLREMTNLHYIGLNKNNEPLDVWAQKAVQAGALEDAIDLITLRAVLERVSGQKVKISSDMGHFDQKTNHIFLSGNVHLVDESGYDLRTPTAEIDLNTPAQVWGNDAVAGVGPQGSLEGNGFKITDEGKTIVVNGRPSMQFRTEEINTIGPGSQ